MVKGCLEENIKGELTQVHMINSLKAECFVEFVSQESCQDWKKLVVDKAINIENFLNRDRISIGSIGEIKASSLSEQEKARMIGEKLDKKNDFDHLVKDDPFQL